jgi:hypothetical protein
MQDSWKTSKLATKRNMPDVHPKGSHIADNSCDDQQNDLHYQYANELTASE